MLALLVCAGCAATDAEPGVSPRSDSVGPRDVEGTWTGDWGRLYLWTDVMGTTKGIYSIHVGTVQGTMADGVFSGWWCEAPTRRPPANAGEVELHFVRGADGVLVIDGRWRYGATGRWLDGFDGVRRVAEPIDKTTQARLNDTDELCAGPRTWRASARPTSG